MSARLDQFVFYFVVGLLEAGIILSFVLLGSPLGYFTGAGLVGAILAYALLEPTSAVRENFSKGCAVLSIAMVAFTQGLGHLFFPGLVKDVDLVSLDTLVNSAGLLLLALVFNLALFAAARALRRDWSIAK